MTPHHELAVAIRHAVFDEVERNGLVSTGIERAIENALILAAARGGERGAVSAHQIAISAAAIDFYNEAVHSVLFSDLPPLVYAALARLQDLINEARRHGQA